MRPKNWLIGTNDVSIWYRINGNNTVRGLFYRIFKFFWDKIKKKTENPKYCLSQKKYVWPTTRIYVFGLGVWLELLTSLSTILRHQLYTLYTWWYTLCNYSMLLYNTHCVHDDTHCVITQCFYIIHIVQWISYAEPQKRFFFHGGRIS